MTSTQSSQTVLYKNQDYKKTKHLNKQVRVIDNKKIRSTKTIQADHHRKEVNQICLHILTSITISQMLKDRSWSKDTLVDAVVKEYGLPIMNQTLSQLKRIVMRLVSQTI